MLGHSQMLGNIYTHLRHRPLHNAHPQGGYAREREGEAYGLTQNTKTSNLNDSLEIVSSQGESEQHHSMAQIHINKSNIAVTLKAVEPSVATIHKLHCSKLNNLALHSW